jgi:hypothetical protein
MLVPRQGVNLRTVWKYTLELEKEQIIEMPAESTILAIQKQGQRHEDEVCMWIYTDPSQTNLEKRKFLWVGTGETIPLGDYRLSYVATLQLMRGVHALHLFEVTE